MKKLRGWNTYTRALKDFKVAKNRLALARDAVLDNLKTDKFVEVELGVYVTKRLIHVSEYLVEVYDFFRIVVTGKKK